MAIASSPSTMAGAPPNLISVDRRNNVLELSWADTEERLKGSIQPEVPRKGEPLKVLLHVGSFEGEEFRGPLTVTLRRAGETIGQTKLITRGPVNWSAEFTPEEEGRHTLSVGFRTTRHKALNADFEVAPSLVPRFILWGLGGLLALVTLAFGIRSLVRQEKPPEIHPVLAELKAAQAAPAPSVPASTAPAPTSAQLSAPTASAPPIAAQPGAEPEGRTESSTGSAPDKPSAL